ncbi:MAG TPA: hypothetical protein VMB02_06430 [Candidatus Aquilonibacter sp.]|nr:hypothetical protein [Candidatus Aquilonibacter sp.]
MTLRRLLPWLGLIALVLLLPLGAHAQDRFDLFGGYSYLRVGSTPGSSSFNLFKGWEFAGDYKFKDWLGGVADFSGHYGSPQGQSTSISTFLFGPQVSWQGRVSPFAQLLGGAAHANVGHSLFTDTAPAAAVGGGIDYQLNHVIYWRVIQGDYIITHLFGHTQSNGRLSTGIVFKF